MGLEAPTNIKGVNQAPIEGVIFSHVGSDGGSPFTPEYTAPFEFTGTIDSVTVDVSGELIRDTEAEIRQIMARQQ